MAMAVDMALWIAEMVWVALSGWISSCLTVADEVASSLRSGDIGPFHGFAYKQLIKYEKHCASCIPRGSGYGMILWPKKFTI